MKTVNRSIFNISDHIVSNRIPVYSCYDNKKLSEFDHDDFASYVFDKCDMNIIPQWSKDHWLYQIEMLDYIPRSYARVYLYGVWDVVKDAIKTNNKTNHNENHNEGRRRVPAVQ